MRLIDAEALQEQMRHIVGLFGDKYRSVRLAIDAAPTIEPAAPDRVLASDVVEGIVCYTGYYIEFSVESCNERTAYLRFNQRLPTQVCLRMIAVLDLLNGALDRDERIDWPDGSPGCRFRKAEAEPPTLLEAWEAFRATDKPFCLGDLRRLDAAAEREKAKQEEGKP